MRSNSIYQKIEEKGSLDAERILKAGEMKAQALHDEIIANASKEIALMLEKAKLRGQDWAKMKKTEQEQAVKKRTLAKKKALIDEVFQKNIRSSISFKR